jgi:hypothetical protein
VSPLLQIEHCTLLTVNVCYSCLLLGCPFPPFVLVCSDVEIKRIKELGATERLKETRCDMTVVIRLAGSLNHVVTTPIVLDESI